MAIVPMKQVLLPKMPPAIDPKLLMDFLRNLLKAVDEGFRTVYAELTTVVLMVDKTGSRAVDTEYQNTTGKYLRVVIAVAAANGNHIAGLLIGAVSPPTMVSGRFGQNAASGAALEGTITAEVPPGWYYTLETTAGSPTITSWLERNIR